jgi:hypothetical protein
MALAGMGNGDDASPQPTCLPHHAREGASASKVKDGFPHAQE